MKTLTSLCLAVLLAPRLAAAPAVRTFAPPLDRPKVSGYAEVVFHVDMSRPVKCEFLNRTRIWFDGKERYRIELLGIVKHKPSPVVVMLRLGDHVYMSSPIYRDPKRKEDWWGGPESCMPGSLEAFLTPGTMKMRNSRLLGVKRVLGLRAEHWRGVNLRGTTFDVYNSVDRRFPLVLARESKSPERLSNWRITKLILRPVPAYLFSTQVHPRPGVGAMLAQPFRSYPVTLALHVILLCCYIALALSLSRSRGWKGLGLSVLLGGAILIALYGSRAPMDYWYQWSDVPPMLLLGLLTCAAMALMWRIAGPPGNIAPVGRVGWKALICALVLAGFSFVRQYSCQHQLTHSLGLDNWSLPFLPVTLLNVMICIIPAAAMEELLFRGYIYAALERWLQSPAKVIAIQALLFGIYHFPKELNQAIKYNGNLLCFMDAPIMVLFGVLFGVLRWKYRGLAAPWLVHAALNTASFYVGSAAMLGFLRALQS